MSSRGSPQFQAAEAFEGARKGAVFKLGPLGLGYYLDASQTLLPQLRPQLPDRWRNANSLREESLRVDPKDGAGLSLEHSDFGFVVEAVATSPGQDVAPGEVIVAMEGRLLCGLSAPQMQASFQKRRVGGTRMHVASLAELQYLAARDPNIVETWDAQHQAYYYFHKKTGRSSWSRDELEIPAAPAEAGGSASSTSAAPVDLSNFLLHGFAKPKEPPKKKHKPTPAEKAKAAAAEAAVADGSGDLTKDESDLAREERGRWNDWNEGGRGGYTEEFFARYKNCTSNPGKALKDKRLKGSVGPGQGMEYMARWTGSKNSFN